MIRTEGFYWVKGYKWSDEPRWFIVQWLLNSWWSDGDDFDDDAFIEIDETLIVREQKTKNNATTLLIPDVSGNLDDDFWILLKKFNQAYCKITLNDENFKLIMECSELYSHLGYKYRS